MAKVKPSKDQNSSKEESKTSGAAKNPQSKAHQSKLQPRKPSVFSFDLYDLVMFVMIIFHVLLNPYTKVEETFITNNMYDHLVYKTNVKGHCTTTDCSKVMEYDFIEFPGVVERSFIPSLIVAFLSYPVHHLLVELLQVSVVSSLYVTRAGKKEVILASSPSYLV